MGFDVAFWILAVISIIAAVMVVAVRNVFRAALSLVICFLVVAGLYITLSADFLAAVQVLVYVGAIAVLIILAIMLTRDVHQGSPSNTMKKPAFFVSLLFFGAGLYAVLYTPWQISTAPPTEPTTPALAGLLFGQGGFVLAVEIAVVMLLAAVIGAIVLVREK